LTGTWAALVVGAVAAVALGRACLPAAAQEAPGKDKRTRSYYGMDSCTDCHIKGFANPEKYICRGIEVPIWRDQDKHALAYRVLDDKRAQDIGKLLGGWDVKNKKECLACHCVWVEEKQDVKLAKSFKREEGVSCVACHGVELFAPTDKLAVSWIVLHSAEATRETWRGLTRAAKEADYGMTDLWDPVCRTQVCASCHIGNFAEGKFVTHEMYAAGHPPLPSFEVTTFSNQMPRHWQYLKEKSPSVLKLLNLNEPEAELEETHLLAIGGLVAFGDHLKLLEAQAATKDWPELAQFDCYACHHELLSKSWRQERGYAGKPGRPPLRQWPAALVDVGLLHAAGDAPGAEKAQKEFAARLQGLQDSFNAQPFGDPADVKQRAGGLADWVELQAKQIQKRIAKDDKAGGYGPNTSARLLAMLIDLLQHARPGGKGQMTAKRFVPDFDSARQLAWAFQVLYLETVSKHDPKAREDAARAMQDDPVWKALDDYVRLTLPRGQTKLEPSLPLSLERIGQYDPRQYFERMDAVLKKFRLPQ
jgi:hypothetical protein